MGVGEMGEVEENLRYWNSAYWGLLDLYPILGVRGKPVATFKPHP